MQSIETPGSSICSPCDSSLPGPGPAGKSVLLRSLLRDETPPRDLLGFWCPVKALKRTNCKYQNGPTGWILKFETSTLHTSDRSDPYFLFHDLDLSGQIYSWFAWSTIIPVLCLPVGICMAQLLWKCCRVRSVRFGSCDASQDENSDHLDRDLFKCVKLCFNMMYMGATSRYKFTRKTLGPCLIACLRCGSALQKWSAQVAPPYSCVPGNCFFTSKSIPH